MAKGYRPVDRDQQFLLPPSLQDWLPPGHVARLVVVAVGQMDTSAFHVGKERKALSGRAAYNPDMVLALLVYAYAHGVRSSRQIERLCDTDVAMRWICAQDAPDHSTLSRFVQSQQDNFAGFFAQVLVLCAKAGLGRLAVVAVDGTKVAANASLSANRDREWFAEQARSIVADAVRTDQGEDELFGEARGDEVDEELTTDAGRAARIRRCLQELEAEQAAEQESEQREQQQVAEYRGRVQAGERLTGPPPRGSDRVELARVRYERALAERRREVELLVANAGGDRRKLPKAGVEDEVMVRRARAALERAERKQAEQDKARQNSTTKRAAGQKALRNVTDPDSRIMPTRNGWVQGYNAQLAVADDQLVVAVALTQEQGDQGQLQPMMAAAEQAAAMIAAARCAPAEDRIATMVFDAGYASEANFTAPGPARLVALGKGSDQHNSAAQNPACGPPPPDASPAEVMSHALGTAEGAKTYKRRGVTVEPVNGHLKDITGLRRFRRRGVTAAAAELNLDAAVLNLRKLFKTAPAPA